MCVCHMNDSFKQTNFLYIYIYIYKKKSWVQVTPNVILKNVTTLNIFLTKCKF